MKLTLGFSPCPNDTFIFDALVNHRIDTGGLEFEPRLEDVETLNRWAQEGKLAITKLSFPAFFQSKENYLLLDAGSALGKGVGPLLVSKNNIGEEPDERPESGVGSPEPGVGSLESGSERMDIDEKTIALPGEHTTANLLFSFAFPGAKRKQFMIFSEIEDAVLNGETELGVIIHENRFTYAQKGLYQLKDLGAYWEEKMKLPVPLGGIAIDQSVKRSVALKVNELIRESIEFAFSHYPQLSPYVQEHAQEMEEAVMRQHIDLYVNNYSRTLGEEGRKAIYAMYSIYQEINHVAGDEEAEELFI